MIQTGESNEAPRVLVVEDDPVSATLIQRLFTSQGMTVDYAQDGAVALRMHREYPYRIVVSDWMMPEMDGVSLCREFRRLDGPYVYFILCSAKHQKEDRLEAYDAGVDDFLTKPLDRHEMQARLKVARRILSGEDALQQRNVELAASNKSIEIASQRFQGLFSGLPAASFTFDPDGLVREWNRFAHDVFGIESQDAINRPIWDVLGVHGETVWTPERVRSFFNGAQQPLFDWQFGEEPDTKYLAASVICMRDGDDSQSAICTNLDITERKHAEQQIAQQMIQINGYVEQLNQQKLELERINNRLNHLAITDGLTGLWNHRRFQEMLEASVDEFTRTGEPFSLVLLDIDYFKRINDELGHQVGDEVLKQFSETLRQQSRSYELPARYGGEEFAILLRCGVEDAIFAAERFRKAIEQEDWKTRPITASFGVATCTQPGTTSKVLIRQADAALYTAKQAGRNRTVHYRSLSTSEGSSLVNTFG